MLYEKRIKLTVIISCLSKVAEDLWRQFNQFTIWQYKILKSRNHIDNLKCSKNYLNYSQNKKNVKRENEEQSKQISK